MQVKLFHLTLTFNMHRQNTDEEGDEVSPLEGFIQQRWQQQQLTSLGVKPAGASNSEAFGDYSIKSDRMAEGVRFHGNAATSVNTNASVQSFQSVLTSSSASSVTSKKTKFHSFLQSSNAATTQQSHFGTTISGLHQTLSSSSSKSISTTSGCSTVPISSPLSPSQLVFYPSFGKMFGEMESGNEFKLKKSIQLNRKISILSPVHLSIRSEQSKEERTSCYINAEILE